MNSIEALWNNQVISTPVPANPFYGTRGSRNAKIVIVGEAWGQHEERQKLPFVGNTGDLLNKLLSEAQIPYNECFFTNVVSERPAFNKWTQFCYRTTEAKKNGIRPYKGLYLQPKVYSHLAALKEQINRIKPDLVIALGNYALWALTDDCYTIGDSEGYKVPQGIAQWRGSMMYTSEEFGRIRLLPTYHPASTFQTYPWKFMIQHDLRVRVPRAFDDRWLEPEWPITIRPNFDQVTQFLNDTLCHLEQGKVEVTLDLETRGPHIACCGLGTNKVLNYALVIPFMCVERDSGYWSPHEEFEIVKLLRKILTHPNLFLIGQNLLYDVQVIANEWFCIPRISLDTMVTHHLLFPGGGDSSNYQFVNEGGRVEKKKASAKSFSQGIQKKALYNLASLYCEWYCYWKDEGKFWDTNMPEEDLWLYNGKDIFYTTEVASALKEQVEKERLQEQYLFQHRVLNDLLIPMMLRGILRDEEATKEAAKLLTKAQAKFDEYLENLIPDYLKPRVKAKKSAPWYTSSKKQMELFYETLGVKPILNKKTKNPTLSKEALPLIAQREPILAPVVKKLELRRSVGVYYSTFIEAESDPDGRIRCSYSATGTDTFRLSSSENIYGRGGNLQNIPDGKEDEETKFRFPNVRNCFIPDPGYEIAEFDLSGADAQVVAWEANDEDLKKAFRDGLKIHIKNCRDMYPERCENLTNDEIKEINGGTFYRNVKALCHATNYTGTPKTLAERLKMSVRAVEEFQERWFFLHPGIETWHRRYDRFLQGIQCWQCENHSDGRGSGLCSHCGATLGRTIRNKFGYRIIFFDRINECLSKAVAWTPQSTVAINCNKGGINLVDSCPWVQLLMQVHDSLIVQYQTKYHDRLPEIKEALHKVTVPYEDPLTIPWGCKVSRESWGEAKEINW